MLVQLIGFDGANKLSSSLCSRIDTTDDRGLVLYSVGQADLYPSSAITLNGKRMMYILDGVQRTPSLPGSTAVSMYHLDHFANGIS